MGAVKLRSVVLGLVVLLIVAGCRAGQVSVQRDGAGNLDISVKISEADINSSIQNILASSQGLKLQNATVDLQNGQILVSGDYTRPDGSSGHGSFNADHERAGRRGADTDQQPQSGRLDGRESRHPADQPAPDGGFSAPFRAHR